LLPDNKLKTVDYYCNSFDLPKEVHDWLAGRVEISGDDNALETPCMISGVQFQQEEGCRRKKRRVFPTVPSRVFGSYLGDLGYEMCWSPRVAASESNDRTDLHPHKKQ